VVDAQQVKTFGLFKEGMYRAYRFEVPTNLVVKNSETDLYQFGIELSECFKRVLSEDLGSKDWNRMANTFALKLSTDSKFQYVEGEGEKEFNKVWD